MVRELEVEQVDVEEMVGPVLTLQYIMFPDPELPFKTLLQLRLLQLEVVLTQKLP